MGAPNNVVVVKKNTACIHSSWIQNVNALVIQFAIVMVRQPEILFVCFFKLNRKKTLFQFSKMPSHQDNCKPKVFQQGKFLAKDTLTKCKVKQH